MKRSLQCLLVDLGWRLVPAAGFRHWLLRKHLDHCPACQDRLVGLEEARGLISQVTASWPTVIVTRAEEAIGREELEPSLSSGRGDRGWLLRVYAGLAAVAVPPGTVSGVIGGVIPERPTEPVPLKDAVRAVGDIAPPKIIKKVEPVYPEEARQAGVEGIVILEVTTDRFGRVAAVRVLRSVPLLDQAAIEAVKQWVYEPVIIDGQPRPIVFTVTVSFKLK